MGNVFFDMPRLQGRPVSPHSRLGIPPDHRLRRSHPPPPFFSRGTHRNRTTIRLNVSIAMRDESRNGRKAGRNRQCFRPCVDSTTVSSCIFLPPRYKRNRLVSMEQDQLWVYLETGHTYICGERAAKAKLGCALRWFSQQPAFGPVTPTNLLNQEGVEIALKDSEEERRSQRRTQSNHPAEQ